MFLVDTRVISQYPAGVPAPLYSVHAQRFEVMFHDGSAVQLHQVTEGAAPAPATFLRAVQREGLRWAVFDLRRLLGTLRGGELEADVLRLQPRDTPGVVFFTLRMAFGSARAFHMAMEASAAATWWHADATALQAAA